MASASKSSFYDVLTKSNDSTSYERNRRDVTGTHVDPHSNDLHCVDVSTYEDVVWDELDREKCTASFSKIREPKREQVSFTIYLHSSSRRLAGEKNTAVIIKQRFGFPIRTT